MSQTKFYRVKDSLKGSRKFCMYSCPICRQKTRIIISDLLKPSQLSDSFELGLFYQRLFNQKSRPENKEELFRDFYCSGCFQPVRIIYRKHSSAAGGYSVQMLRLQEMTHSSFPSRKELTRKLNRLIDLFYSLSFNQHPSCHPYLWLAALILFSGNYDSPNRMARTFSLHSETLARFLEKKKISERADKSLPVLFYGQFSLWLSVVIKSEKQVESVLAKVSEISESLASHGTRGRLELLLNTFILTLGNHPEGTMFKLELIRAQLKKSFLEKRFPCTENFGPLWESLLLIILGIFAGVHYTIDRVNQINHILGKKHFPLAQKDRKLASLFLWFPGGAPEICVKRFMKVGQAFGLAAAQKKAVLSDPGFVPKEGHPFRNVVSSFLHEFSPVFPFDSAGFLPIALLSTLPWKAEDLAWESMELYSYLRSFRRYISPSMSFWIATGLVFSSWEHGNFPEVVLFWTLTGLAILTELEFREECADTLLFPQI